MTESQMLQQEAIKQTLIAASRVPGIVEALAPLAVAAPLASLAVIVEALQELVAAQRECRL